MTSSPRLRRTSAGLHSCLPYALILGLAMCASGCIRKTVRADEDESQAGIRQESEDREGEKTSKLVDVHEPFVAYVNEVLVKARAGGGEDAEDVLRAVFDALGAKVKGTGYSVLDIVKLSGVEVWLETTLKPEKNEIVRLTWAESRYGANEPGLMNWKTPTLLSKGGANHAIVPTIRLQGTLVGIDKWAHFFNTGYLYYANESLRKSEDLRTGVSRWLEGDPTLTKEDREKFAPHARAIGYLLFGFLGAWSTGVVSKADMYANEQGYKFYAALAGDPKTYRFSLADIDVNMLNEVKNPSTFKEGLKTDP